MGDHTAFFYGTLMAPSVLRRVCYGHSDAALSSVPINLQIRPALLPSFQRRKVRHCDYPAILPTSSPDDTVRGTVVTGLTDGDIYRLDVFEGSEYERRKVRVRVVPEVGEDEGKGGEEEMEAETYVWISPKEELEEEEWDFAEFAREKLWRWAGEKAEGEGEYKEVDEAVKELESDPTGGRHVNGGNITQNLEAGRKGEGEILGSAV